MNWVSRFQCSVAFAAAVASCAADAYAQQTGGIAPLYAHAPRASQRAASARLTLPNVASNKSWYANWIMLVGESPAVGHQMFVQIGMIRRPSTDPRLHLFIAWHEAGAANLEYRQYGHLTDGVHRFSIAQNADRFSLLADGKEIARLRLPVLARASRTYFEIGPEVYAQGDALAGDIVDAAWRTAWGWDAASDEHVCRYNNHGVYLRYDRGRWSAHGRFDRNAPSAFDGSCAAI